MKDLELHRSGIYHIVINGKEYIGAAIDIAKRWSEHIYSFKKGTCSKKMAIAIKEGIPIFEVLEFCEKWKLHERELYYYNTRNPVLNSMRPIEHYSWR